MAAPAGKPSGALLVVTTGNLTPVLPAHLADDILIVGFGFWGPNSTGNPLAAVAAPSGWTEITQFDAPALDGKIGWFWKRAVSSSEANPTLVRPSGWDTGTDTAWGGRAYVVEGCITSGDPWDQAVASSVYSAANQAIAAVTVSGTERSVIHHLVKCDDFVTAPTVSGWSAGAQVESATGTDHSQGTFFKNNISTSTTADASTVEAPATGRYAFLGISFKPPGPQTVSVAGRTSVSSFGTVTPSQTGPQTVAVAGRSSTSSFGAVQANIAFSVTGRTSASSFGAVTTLVGGVVVAVAGRTSSSSFGIVLGVPGIGDLKDYICAPQACVINYYH